MTIEFANDLRYRHEGTIELNYKPNFLSDEEEVHRMVELRGKGEADRIARIELAIEKSQLEMAKKMFNNGYATLEISELLDVPENTIQRWRDLEMINNG